MNTKKTLVAMLIGGLVLAVMAAAPPLSKKISLFGYKSEAAGIKLIVDGGVARLRGEEKFIPLLVWLGHSEKKTIRVNRESFTLTDPQGNSYPMPSHSEVVEGYGAHIMSFDYELARKTDDYGSMDFLSCKFMRKIAFFPDPSSSRIMYDNVELPNRSYFRTILYFPNKAGKSDGAYVLSFEDKSSEAKVSTFFKIDWMN